MNEYSHYIQDLLSGEFVEAHFLELPFETRIVMRVHESKLDFLTDLLNPYA